MRIVLLAVVLVLSGCVGAEDAREAPPSTTPRERNLPGPDLDSSFVVERVEPANGMLLTYRQSYPYDPAQEVRIVVVHQGAGFLFAPATVEDAWFESVWWHPLMGPRDATLTREGWTRKLLDLPLRDGKSWEYREGLTVTAAETDVTTPLGTERGFYIGGHDDPVRVSWEFAPSLGVVTRMTLEADNGWVETYQLTSVGQATNAVWYEVLADVQGGVSDPPPVLQVPDGADAVVLTAGGANGGRAAYARAGAPPDAWTFESAGIETWGLRAADASPGAWSVALAAQPDGWAYARAVAVRWVDVAV